MKFHCKLHQLLKGWPLILLFSNAENGFRRHLNVACKKGCSPGHMDPLIAPLLDFVLNFIFKKIGPQGLFTSQSSSVSGHMDPFIAPLLNFVLNFI